MIENQLLYFRGRVALKELLIASGIKKDEKVAIQAYTCSAVPEGVFAANALPIYIDVIKRGVTMCPDDLVDKSSLSINNLQDLGNHQLIKIKHFFEHYKDNEPSKWVNVGDFKPKEIAIEIIKKSKIHNTNYLESLV